QVNETWLIRYRRWVYASGFGWQIGTGVATYVMTAGVYLLVVMASLGGRPVAAVILGTVFGAVRGMTVLLTARATTPQALGALHRRIHDLTSASRSVVVVVQGGVAFTAALASASGEASPASVAIAALAFAVLVAVVGRVRRADRPPSTDRSADTALLSNQ
ncbi:MAG: hypothetical protein JWL70_4, partial [Acidimicrobiia bacterium]|nr:hypothetical protein [Acidimicrobiia bacterium]